MDFTSSFYNTIIMFMKLRKIILLPEKLTLILFRDCYLAHNSFRIILEHFKNNSCSCSFLGFHLGPNLAIILLYEFVFISKLFFKFKSVWSFIIIIL